MAQQSIPFHVPDIGEAEIAAVVETLRSGWLTTGPKVRAFETAFAEYIGVPHAVAVNSCTAALHLALDAIGLREGDEVLVPTMTFAATAEVVSYFRARPVLVDCLPDTLNIDPARVEEAITPRTRAIILVHYAGHACDMDAIVEIARRRGLFVIEDAAHALPAGYKGRKVGTLGDIACFSFYATKTLCTGEGGMLVTANFAERARIMSLHGISKDAWKKYSADGSWYYEILQPGFKYNVTDIAAALGLVQLSRCDQMREQRCRVARIYDAEFKHSPQIETPAVYPDVQHSRHLYPIRLNLERLRFDRARFIDLMRERGIGVSVHFIPLHLYPYYRDKFGYRPEDLPNASDAYSRIISLPIYPAMSDRDAQFVARTARSIQ